MIQVCEKNGSLLLSSGGPSRGRVLLLHGYGQSRYEVLPLATRLAQGGWEVLAPDLPGHGGSSEHLSPASVHEFIQAWKSEPSPDLLIGHSLGARIALALGGAPRVIAISPPVETHFDESTRTELLSYLRPRWVREEKPMAALAELLRTLPMDSEGAESGLVLLAQKELAAVHAGTALWRDRAAWTVEKVRHTDHGSIHLSAATAERILSWT